MAQRELNEYQEERDFSSSPEPSDGCGGEGENRFVIQKHMASSLHYDFRLEAGGVLKSWAVPKGPSTDPSEKRLALPTEDHPVDYLDFEGVIPEGEYGGGTVLVWDTGDYENTSTDEEGNLVPILRAHDEGHISVELHGKKVAGGYALTRTGVDENARWLLVKKDDNQADARRNPTSTEPRSVLTGRTIDDIAEDDDDE